VPPVPCWDVEIIKRHYVSVRRRVHSRCPHALSVVTLIDPGQRLAALPRTSAPARPLGRQTRCTPRPKHPRCPLGQPPCSVASAPPPLAHRISLHAQRNGMRTSHTGNVLPWHGRHAACARGRALQRAARRDPTPCGAPGRSSKWIMLSNTSCTPRGITTRAVRSGTRDRDKDTGHSRGKEGTPCLEVLEAQGTYDRTARRIDYSARGRARSSRQRQRVQSDTSAMTALMTREAISGPLGGVPGD